MKSINEILEQYKSGEITLEEANAELMTVEANFHLKHLSDAERAEKKRREDEEGTIDIGRGPENK